MVGVRRATAEDVRAIAKFQTRCWNEAYRGLVDQAYLDRTTADVREVRWRQRLLHDGVDIALTEIETKNNTGTGDPTLAELVGVVSWSLSPVTDAPPLELRSLYVAASHRGLGVAAALITEALGPRPARLWAFEANHRALAFYRKHGFRPDGHGQLDVDTGIQEIRLVRP